MRRTWGTVGLAALALVSAVGCGPMSGPSTAVGRVSASAELQGRWWTWAASEPEETNPVADDDGSVCHRNQPEDVWFLAGTFGGEAKRGCTVPAGRPIVVPLVNTFGDRPNCVAFMSDVEGTALLDGTPVEPETYAGDPITVRARAGNAVTGEAERFTTTGCGLWVRLPAPGPGQHILKISGRSGGFSVGVEYRLTIEGASRELPEEPSPEEPRSEEPSEEPTGHVQAMPEALTGVAPVVDEAGLSPGLS
ncbi:signal protein [Streptomyces sp. NPDC007346]|uniref:signal protein n=1 Tax=Streptomyces sp. NPDC007346 TaxID=3154682 RepID=UPI0034514F77